MSKNSLLRISNLRVKKSKKNKLCQNLNKKSVIKRESQINKESSTHSNLSNNSNHRCRFLEAEENPNMLKANQTLGKISKSC
jgi:hypothetical protein